MMFRLAFAADTELCGLIAMFKILGTPGEREWPGVTNLPNFSPKVGLTLFPNFKKQGFLFEAFGMDRGACLWEKREDGWWPCYTRSPYYYNKQVLDLTERLVLLRALLKLVLFIVCDTNVMVNTTATQVVFSGPQKAHQGL